MKAKMPLKPPETGKYLCTECNTKFLFVQGIILKCPRCGNATRSDIVTLEIKENPDEDEFYTDDDFIGG